MPQKIVTVRLGRIHAEGTKVNYNEGKVDGLVRELQLEGWKVAIERSLEAEARSVALVRNGEVVAGSTYEDVKSRGEVLRLVSEIKPKGKR